MSGSKSIGKRDKENRPKIATATKQSVVIIGRLTAPSYKLIIVLFKVVKGLFYNFNFYAISQTILTGNDNLIIVFNT